ncbi:MAG: hypothetical protein E7053_06200 [Lentisphaerae bacterium]|nr:hypothetical protein [Lentisphaerota bacterium]
MAWQCILGLIVMVGGFAGVLVCAKIQKTNPSIQPVAMACAVVMLIGLGLYFWFYLNPPNYAMEHNRIYGLSVAHTIGGKLQGKKVIWLASGTTSEDFQARKAALEAACGGSVTVVEASDPENGMMMDGAKFKEAIAGADADTVVIIDTDVSGFANDLNKLLGDRKPGVKFVFTENSVGMLGGLGNLKKGFDNGRILFAVVADKHDEEFSPDEDELDEAFSKRYTIIDKDNFEASKEKLGVM